MAITHLAFGFLSALFSIQYLHPKNQILFLVLVLVGSLLPDIDHPKSTLGKRFKIFGWLFEHRGFWHSINALAIFAFISFLLFQTSAYFYALPIGYVSHLVTDMITKEGVMWLHPLSKTRINGMIKTGSLLEYLFFIIVFVLGVLKLLSF